MREIIEKRVLAFCCFNSFFLAWIWLTLCLNVNFLLHLVHSDYIVHHLFGRCSCFVPFTFLQSELAGRIRLGIMDTGGFVYSNLHAGFMQWGNAPLNAGSGSISMIAVHTNTPPRHDMTWYTCSCYHVANQFKLFIWILLNQLGEAGVRAAWFLVDIGQIYLLYGSCIHPMNWYCIGFWSINRRKDYISNTLF